MLLSSLPSRRDDTSDRRPPDDAPLHERLFGEHSTSFYVRVGFSITMMSALLVVVALYAPRHVPRALGALALPVFLLLEGSPSQRVQAIAVGIMGGLIWSYVQVEPLVVAAGALVTGVASYVCGTLMTRELAALTGQTRRQRIPTLARLSAAVVVNSALVAVPAALIVHGYLTGRGWSTEAAGFVVVSGVTVLALIGYHQTADEIPGTVDG